MSFRDAFAAMGLAALLALSCKPAEFSGANAARPIKKPDAAVSGAPVYVPVGGSVPIPGGNGSTQECTPKDASIAGCKDGEIIGNEQGTTTIKVNDKVIDVIVYDPNHPPPGAPTTGAQSIYVPLGGTTALPSVGGTTACVSTDPHIANCANGAVTGNNIGNTTVKQGDQTINVVVYDPANPPPGVIGGNSSGGSGILGSSSGAATGGNTGLDASTTGGSPGGSLGTEDGSLAVRNTEPLILEQLQEGDKDADDAMTVTVTRIDAIGNVLGAPQSFPFEEHKAGLVSASDLCTRNGDTFLMLSFQDHDSNKTMTPESRSGGGLFGSPQPLVARTGGGYNVVEITVDDGKCAIGTCVDRGSDNTFRLTCPHGAVYVRNLQ